MDVKLDIQSNKRVTRRLGIHAVGYGLPNSFNASERSAVSDVFYVVLVHFDSGGRHKLTLGICRKGR